MPFGKYLLLDRINVGGMAEVWRGKMAGGLGGIERLVAVKRILPNIAEDEEFVTMFMDEARLTVQLAHANIAQIYDFSFERVHNSYFIAMEYIPGKDLRAVFDRCRKLGEPAPVPLICYVMGQVCDGLDYAHQKKDGAGRPLNIVHRDISPQNVLISYDGDVKVIDFGVAKAAGKATRTQAGILKGKFGYMSPEQARAQVVDRRSDIFAIGVCLHELLTGARLFTGDSDFSVLDKVRDAEIPLPSVANPNVAPGLEKIVQKALSRDLTARYQYASEMAEDLQRYLITSNSLFTRKDLAQYMRATFAEDVERELARLAEYADVRGSPPTPDTAPRRLPTPAEDEAVEPTRSMVKAEGGTLESLGPPVTLRLSRTASADVPAADGRTLWSGEHADEQTHLTVDSGEQKVSQRSGLSEATPVADTTRSSLESVRSAHEAGQTRVDASSSEEDSTGAPVLRSGNGRAQSAAARLRLAWGLLTSWPPLDAQRARWVALAGVAALVASALLFLISTRRGPAILALDLPPALQGRAHLHLNDEDLGIPAHWPLLRRVHPGRTRVFVEVEGYLPFQRTVNVSALGELPVTLLSPLPLVEQARLVVATVPEDAEVRLDGRTVRARGTHELFLSELPVGKDALLEVSAPGFRSLSRTLRAQTAGDAQVVRAELERDREDFTVRVTSRPSNALVWSRGQLLGRTPLSFRSAGGSIVVRQRCFSERQESIPAPDASGGALLHVELRRLSSCR